MKKVFVTLMVLVAAVLATGTVFERYRGADWVGDHFYGSWWFAVLMGLVAVGAVISIVMGKLWRRPSALLIHTAVPVILLGGALTTWTGQHYSITLAPGESKEGITLESFEVVHYPGTHTPMDFVSHVTVADGPAFRKEDISMNHILRHNGRRFYQEDYDDEGRSTLSVSHDPWGIPVVYTGFALLLVGLLWLTLTHSSVSRQAADSSPSLGEQLVTNSSPKLGRGMPVASRAEKGEVAVDAHRADGGVCKILLTILLFLPLASQAAPRTLPRETAGKMGEMFVLYKGRICPLQTFAKDFTTKLTGKASYKGLSSEQVLSGFLFYYGDWADFQVEKKRKVEGEALVKMLLSGKLLKLFPVADSSGTLGWYAQNDDLPMTVSDEEYLFIRKHLSYCQELVVKGDYAALEQVFDKIRLFQVKRAADVLPSPTRVKAERLYNALTAGRWLAMLAITLGLLSFVYSLWCQGRGKGMPCWLKTVLTSYLIVLSSYLLLIFVLRWIAGGHLPMAGGFDSMNLMAITIGLIGLVLSLKQSSNQAIKQSSAMLTMGFCLLVAMMSGSNPPVTNLMPVLNSPLLCLHVAVIMIAYALFFILMMIGVAGLVAKGNEQYHRLGQQLLYPAVFLLALGIVIGTLWANISWGNYWSWDPKEVWALITLIVYAIPLHPGLKVHPSGNQTNNRAFFLYCTLAFLSVIVTYFGVNLLLGGIHAYN